MKVHNASLLDLPGTYHKSLDPVPTTDVIRFLTNLNVWQGLVLLGFIFWAISSLFIRRRITVSGAPVLGYRSWFEPTLLLQLRYTTNAHQIISKGYEKFKDKPFVIRRHDYDITILPNKYIQELRTIPVTKLSRGKANSMEWGDQWAMNTMWSHSELPIRAIADNRNGQLSRYLESIRRELNFAFETEVPQTNDWTEVDIQQIIRMVLVRIIGKMIVGETACRSPEWLELGEHFTEDFVTASFIMRLIPPWMHPFVTNLIPQRWRLRRRLRDTAKIVNPAIARHQEAARRKAQGTQLEKDDSMLDWMMDNGNDKDYLLKNMPILVLVILVPAAHTTAMAISNILFDLCAHPEYFPQLRDEIADNTNELGKIGKGTPVQEWNAKLEKLDSFFNESQRLSQPLAMEDVTFKDGLHIPKGALVGWVGIHNQIDPEVVSDPDQFDPMRSYRKRHSSPDEMTKHLAGQPSRENLSFGFGSQACPGRHIAVNVLKMVVTKLLQDYEFKLPEGIKDKPNSIHLFEFIFPDPAAKLRMRKRQVA